MEQKDKTQTELHYYSDRLKHRLDRLRFMSVSIVEAPSGYGKTTAIRDFLESALPESTPVYWFTAADEVPSAGFRRLCREIDKIDSLAGQRLLRIGLPNAATVGEASDALRSIQCRHDTFLVIDNFQLLQEALLPSFYRALLEHGGKGLHVIVVTQLIKRDMLAAIAGNGFLHITAADLRLNADDIRQYYTLAGPRITMEIARNIERYTGGWMIAVYLQLRVFFETGSFSNAHGIMSLMEHLVWDKLSDAQQDFFLILSPFDTFTVQQACCLIGYDALPDYASESLQNPFIRYEPAEQSYAVHSTLAELLIQKRTERGEAFNRDCLLCAGDYCRDTGATAKALDLYAQTGDYERILSLDLSRMTLEMIGGIPFHELALDIARHCPAEIKQRHPLSMLQIAWALRMAELSDPFDTLMAELRKMLEDNQQDESILLGEWTLLSSFRSFPHLKEMTAALRQAEALFKGRCSQVILPTAPWCFGNYSPLAEFHVYPGEADREADALEEYITLYSRLTNGHGSGADVLFRAELAYHRGNLNEAEVLAYKAVFLAQSKQQGIVQLGATRQLAEIALHKADAAAWQNAINSMEQAASYAAQDFYVTCSIDSVRGVLLNELKHQMSIAEWLKSGDFSFQRLPSTMIHNAMFVHMMFLLHQGEFAKLIGLAQAKYPEGVEVNPFRDMLLSLTLASGYMLLGDKAKAAMLVQRAARMALPDGIIFAMAAYSGVLQGLVNTLIEQEFPVLLGPFNKTKDRFLSGWRKLYDTIPYDALPPDLTTREYEVAKLAAQGLRNSEIAQVLAITESTVRAHLRTIFQKFDIDRRAKLAEKLQTL